MTPEQDMWQNVLYRALLDVTAEVSDKPYKTGTVTRREQEQARNWIVRNGRDFRYVCSLAGPDPDFVREAVINNRIDAKALRAMTHIKAVADD